ncbi:MAG: ABC transporter ATP-binding protein [bacterium]|nr:ABC transporter ATP-binding protein [bacterium]
MKDDSRPLVEVRGLRKAFASRGAFWGSAGPPVHAVAGVDLDIRPGETLGLVGESGSGKSTLGRMIIRLIEPDAGTIRFDGHDLLQQSSSELRRLRREFQIIFQDPYGSLNPRMRVGTTIGEPLTVHRLVSSRQERGEKVAELLEQVGLDPSVASRFPHEFSGGQRQRIGIARAIACSPRFIVADEPVSALDPPVQAQIINLMMDLQERLGLAYLFIAHDLRLVEHICDRVAVMYLGQIVEEGPAREVYDDPKHPYTRALLASTPTLDPGSEPAPALAGEPPSPTEPPPGCPFHPRCPVAEEECSRDAPRLIPVQGRHKVACRLVEPRHG